MVVGEEEAQNEEGDKPFVVRSAVAHLRSRSDLKRDARHDGGRSPQNLGARSWGKTMLDWGIIFNKFRWTPQLFY